jgi:hypothetical protein
VEVEGHHNAGHGSDEDVARGSDLPALYRSPWRNLGEDLRAIGADLSLRLRGLWRRNREGRLWRPAWWPADLAPLFWLLSLGLALLLLLTPLLVGQPAARGGGVRSAAAGSEPVAEGGAIQPATVPPAPEHPAAPPPPVGAGASPLIPEPTGASPEAAAAAPTAVQPPSAAATAATAAAAAAAGMTAAAPAPEAPEPPADPLQLWLQSAPAAELLAGARAEPAAGTLVLLLEPAFSALPADLSQQRAEVWQLQARELGFDHLELRDGSGALRARDALVGSGMIVLPAPPAP